MSAPTVVAVWRTVERGIGGSAASVQAKGRGSTQWKRPWQLAGSDAPFSFANRRPRQGQEGKGGGGRGRHRQPPVEAGVKPSGFPRQVAARRRSCRRAWWQREAVMTAPRPACTPL